MVNPISESSAFTRSCRIIAAVDSNHNGDTDLAHRLIDAAREAGADGVKFVKRTVSLSAVRQVLERPAARYSSLGSTYQKALERMNLPIDVLARLCEYAKDLDIFLAPYDLEACRQLNGVQFTAWKVDSPMMIHLPLLGALGESGRSVVASVAGSTHREIEELLRLLTGEVTLIHSICMNPFTAGVADVAHLLALRRFGRSVGYADNCMDASLSLVAVALGARILEKPLTLDRTMPGPQHSTSLIPQELGELVRKVRALESALNSENIRVPSPEEMDDLEWSRVSIVAACPIPCGARITREMLTLKPPFRGLSPAFLKFLEGRRALYDIPQDEFLTFGLVEL